MSKTPFKGMEHLVVEAGLVEKSVLNALAAEIKSSGKRLSRLLIEKGLVEEEELFSVLEEKYGFKKVSLRRFKPDPALSRLIPSGLALKRNMVPLAVRKEKLILGLFDPLDLAALDDAARMSGLVVEPVMVKNEELEFILNQLYGTATGVRVENYFLSEQKAPAEEAPPGFSEEAPVVKMVNQLMEKAVQKGASDIHLEPVANNLRIRLRVDGVLCDVPSVLPGSAAQVISRIKILANLDIAEKRLPQDGNIKWQGRHHAASLRVSTLPTVNGEKVVIRLLEKERIVRSLESLGFSEKSFAQFLPLLLNQHGLILVTGPTGSGKTTTLYSALNYLNRPGVNLVTVEDPVEYQLAGVNQVQVLPRINRNFAGALRSILRQDPDIIMVGEIRDLETAKITIQAALTGHLVLSTLHTVSAASTVTRLLDMGLEDYLVAASLAGVVAQRLVRTLCPHCKFSYKPEAEEINLFQGFFKAAAPTALFKGRGCHHCNNTGYKGRTSIKEVLVINRKMQDLILKRAPAEELQKMAVASGMETMIEDGERLVAGGQTTPGEIIRSVFSSVFEKEGADLANNQALIKVLGEL